MTSDYTRGDVIDRYSSDERKPTGGMTPMETLAASVRDYSDRVMKDVARGPDKTVAGALSVFGQRVDKVKSILQSSLDIPAAIAADKELQKFVSDNADGINDFRNVDRSLFRDGSAVAHVIDNADRAMNSSYLGDEIQLPNGMKMKYGDLRDPEVMKTLLTRHSGVLRTAGYDDAVADCVLGNTSEIMSGLLRNRGIDPASQTAARIVAESDRTYRNLFGALTSNDFAFSSKVGVNSRGEQDPISRVARTSVANDIAADPSFYETFGTGLSDIGMGIVHEFNGPEASSMLAVAKTIGDSIRSKKGLEGTALAREVMTQLRAFKSGIRVSDSGDRSGPGERYSANEQMAALAAGAKAMSDSGMRFDLESPEVIASVRRFGSVVTKAKSMGIDITKLLRDSGRSVSSETGGIVSRAGGAVTPTTLVERIGELVSERNIVGSSDFVPSVGLRETTDLSDYDSRERRNGGYSRFQIADDLALSVDKADKLAVAEEMAAHGYDQQTARESIMSSITKLEKYSSGIRGKFYASMPGTSEERNAASSVLTTAVIDSGGKLPLVDYVRSVVGRNGFSKDNPLAYRSLSRWLSTVGSDDAEINDALKLCVSKFMSRGANRDDATASAIYFVDSIRRERESSRSSRDTYARDAWRRHLRSFLEKAQVFVPGKEYEYSLENVDLGRHRGSILKVGGADVQIPFDGDLSDVILEVEKRSHGAAKLYDTLKVVNEKKMNE